MTLLPNDYQRGFNDGYNEAKKSFESQLEEAKKEIEAKHKYYSELSDPDEVDEGIMYGFEKALKILTNQDETANEKD